MLLAAWQRRQAPERSLRWLDLMAGCGIRALRWGLEAASAKTGPLELWVNDADADRRALLHANLAPLNGGGGGPEALLVEQRSLPAEVLLRQAYLEQRSFDLIDPTSKAA